MLKQTSQKIYQLMLKASNTFFLSKKVLTLMACLVLILLFIFTPLRTFFDANAFKSLIQQYQGYIEIIFISIYTVLTVIGIPGTILTIVGGCLFGLWYGTIISIISASLGALAAFLVARYLLQNFAQRKLQKSKQLSRFQAAILERPFAFVLTTRLIPISPFNLVNYLFGLTTINWQEYALATVIGVVPGSFAYTWIGVSGEQAMMGGDRLSFYLALTFLALLSIVPLIYQRKNKI